MEAIDIKGGQHTFAQHLELRKIIADGELAEFEKFKACMLCLNPEWKVTYTPKSLEYWEEVLIGVEHWAKREKTELKYNPTAEELAAGIDILSLEVGEMSTLTALAEKFSKDPDDILDWKYGKIFNILYTNLKTFLYTVRLEKQRQKAFQLKTEQGKRGKGAKR